MAELARTNPTLYLQMRVSRMLGCGFALTLVVAGGVGSLVAFVIGLRARGLIKKSDDELSGMRMAWWCIIAGAIGTAVALVYWPQYAWRMWGSK